MAIRVDAGGRKHPGPVEFLSGSGTSNRGPLFVDDPLGIRAQESGRLDDQQALEAAVRLNSKSSEVLAIGLGVHQLGDLVGLGEPHPHEPTVVVRVAVDEFRRAGDRSV